MLLITTGGTIDAEAYSERPATVTVQSQSLIPGALERIGVTGFRHVALAGKDSKLLTRADLEAIAEAIRNASDRHVVITHGTDAMPQNARILRALTADDPVCAPKVILVTGSMTPLANVDSDGWENLRVAAGEGAHYPPGVHIVMHGRRIDPARAVKVQADPATGAPPQIVER